MSTLLWLQRILLLTGVKQPGCTRRQFGIQLYFSAFRRIEALWLPFYARLSSSDYVNFDWIWTEFACMKRICHLRRETEYEALSVVVYLTAEEIYRILRKPAFISSIFTFWSWNWPWPEAQYSLLVFRIELSLCLIERRESQLGTFKKTSIKRDRETVTSLNERFN